MIRVLHIFGQMNRGGAEMRTIELMPALAELGVHMSFCTLARGGGPGQLDPVIRERGGEVIPCPLTRNPFGFAKRFKALLRDRGYDIVHSHVHLKSGWMLRLTDQAGVPGRVMHFRNTNAGDRVTPARHLYNALMRRFADRHAGRVLAVCEAAMAAGWGDHWRRDPRCKVIYNGLNLEPFHHADGDRDALRQELGLPEDARLVVQVGRLTHQKGHRPLIPALPALFDAHPGAHVLMVGEGPLRAEVQGLLEQHRVADRVHLLGVRSDVPRLLKCADLSILPSLWEGLPGVVLESIAAGTRCVATPLPGVREIAAHSGMVEVVEPSTPAALVGRVIGLLAGPMKTEHEPFPEAFSLPRCAHQLFEVYRGLTPAG